MNVNNNLNGLQQIFSSPEVTRTQGGGKAANSTEPLSVREDEATLSPAASLAAQTASDSDVRMDKVTQVQKALADGSYSVPSSEVADKMISHMLGK
jgi:negative regulator of flagellin synthesis FlgM